MVSSINPNVQDMQHAFMAMRSKLEDFVKSTGKQQIILAKMSPGHLPRAPEIVSGVQVCSVESSPSGLALEYFGSLGSAPVPGKGLIGRSRLFAQSTTGENVLAVGEPYDKILQSTHGLPNNTIIALDLDFMHENKPFAHATMPVPFPTRACPWAHEGDDRVIKLLQLLPEWPGKPIIVMKICTEFSERCIYLSWFAKGVGMCSCEVLMGFQDKVQMDAGTFVRLQATIWIISRGMDSSSTMAQRVYALLDG